MGRSYAYGRNHSLEFSWREATGAVGDSVTVLPIVVAVAVLTDLSLAMMLLWFGAFQLIWGLYFGAPISVEPMKALAALILAGTISTGELLIAGLLIAGLLLLFGGTGLIERVQHIFGPPVVRGIQLAVALVLLDTGVRLGLGDPMLAALAVVIAIPIILRGRIDVGAMAVLLCGGLIALYYAGIPSPALPPTDSILLFSASDMTLPAVEATVAQLAMTLGNACLAASVLMHDYFEKDISPDQLASSMGVMNLTAVPFGAFPMCHGSGGIAGKYAFGARTAGANVILGLGYIAVAIFGVAIVTAYPVAMLGVILVLISAQLGFTSLKRASDYWLVVAIGLLGLLVNIGLAFVVGILIYTVLRRY